MNYWADLVGDESFQWSKFLPFYKKSVKYTPNDSIPDETSSFEPHGGPVQISYPPYRQPTNPFISRAFQKLGFKKHTGFNDGLLSGYGYWTVYQDPETHTRSSSATSFLNHALKHTGIQLYPHTQAQKILIREGRASAVIVETAGLNYTITARKEIILSAGFVSLQLIGYSVNLSLTFIRDSLSTAANGFWDWARYHIKRTRHRSFCGLTGRWPEPTRSTLRIYDFPNRC